jgi:hypothetical protein
LGKTEALSTGSWRIAGSRPVLSGAGTMTLPPRGLLR